MENFWTSIKNINGLRHFVLLNKKKGRRNMIYLMVSVLDAEINLEITHEELINSGNWLKGWINLPNIESISEEYRNYKSRNKVEDIDEIFVDDDSPFNIS